MLSLHACTNYCLGFIEPFMLILFCNAINVALFLLLQKQSQLGYIQVLSSMVFLHSLQLMDFCFIQSYSSMGRQRKPKFSYYLFVMVSYVGIYGQTMWIQILAHLSILATMVYMWPTLDLNLAMCFYV